MFTSIIYLVYSTMHIAIHIMSAWASPLYDSLPSPEYTGKRASRPKRSYKRGTSGRNLRNVSASTTLPRISPTLVCLPFVFPFRRWSSNCKLWVLTCIFLPAEERDRRKSSSQLLLEGWWNECCIDIRLCCGLAMTYSFLAVTHRFKERCWR
jgi:hypothetical protein